MTYTVTESTGTISVQEHCAAFKARVRGHCPPFSSRPPYPSALKLRTAARSVVYARSPAFQLQSARAFSLTRSLQNKELEKRLEEQRKIDEQKEKDKKKVYGQHYQDKEELEVPEIAATDDSIAHGWREVSFSAPTPQYWSRDLGHATIGPGHGRHQARTLASFSMEGKVCVVTGAARGLGNLFARTFVESGCTKIVLMDLKQEEAQKAADDLVEWFVEHGDIQPGKVTAIGIGCDVSNEDSVKEGFGQVVSRFGKVDAVVASAGIVENYSAFDYPTNRIRLLYDINVHGAFFCAREAAKHMIEQNTKGSIVLVSSMSANVSTITNCQRASGKSIVFCLHLTFESGIDVDDQPQTPYNSSKAAVKHMAASLAVEWAKSGIRVNALSPGYMLTSLTRTILDKNEELKVSCGAHRLGEVQNSHYDRQNTWVNLTPMGRMGEPEDLKGAVIYLASEASAFTSGTELRFGGTVITDGPQSVAHLGRIAAHSASLLSSSDDRPPCPRPPAAPAAPQHSASVGPISPATGLPDALAHIPIDYIIDRLRSMAPYYWHRPETTNCTIIVPTEPVRMFSRVANGHSAIAGTSSSGPLGAIRDSRRSSAPNAGARQPIRVRLHQDYLTAQSALFRNLFSHSTITHLDPASAGSRPLFTFSSLRHPRMTGPAHNPTVLLPVPDHASFALLVHYLYFGDTRTIENALRTGTITWEGCVRNVEHVRRRATDSVEEEEEEEDGNEPSGSTGAGSSQQRGLQTVLDTADQEAEGREYTRTSTKVHTGQGLVDADELAAMLERV
ncbi:KR domain [Rhizoctonia solani]|uniref:KR domain n=1 Tax=Rhizoctonia solani TaxID=456999 RepID=A0A8H7M8J5_9AGAM|nr:KR domain [Rhizoctonia solani]